MANFIPGTVVSTFASKKGNICSIRYPRWEDLEAYTAYINKLSAEDTFVTFSGEEISMEKEAEYFGKLFKEMEFGNITALGVWIDGTLIALSGVDRIPSKRFGHKAVFGISVDAEYRGEGIGEVLMREVIHEAKKKIDGLRIITLTVFGTNIKAKQLYKKIGFLQDGVLLEGAYFHDEYIDYISMYLPVA